MSASLPWKGLKVHTLLLSYGLSLSEKVCRGSTFGLAALMGSNTRTPTQRSSNIALTQSSVMMVKIFDSDMMVIEFAQ